MRFFGRYIAIWLLIMVCMPIAGFTQRNNSTEPVQVTIEFRDKADNPDFILYNVDNDLKIADFKGPPDRSSAGVGATYSGIQMSLEGKTFNGKTDIHILLMVYFDKSKSWMKPEGKDERVLKHEQIHFDLTGIYACRMYHAIMNEKFSFKNVKQRLHDIQAKFTNELQEQQTLYDKQTKHGTMDDVQKAWAEKVQRMKSEVDCM